MTKIDESAVGKFAFVLACGHCGKRSEIDIRRETGRCPQCQSRLSSFRPMTDSEARDFGRGKLKGADVHFGAGGRSIEVAGIDDMPSGSVEAVVRAADRTMRVNPGILHRKARDGAPNQQPFIGRSRRR